jgi:hypothetical protein
MKKFLLKMTLLFIPLAVGDSGDAQEAGREIEIVNSGFSVSGSYSTEQLASGVELNLVGSEQYISPNRIFTYFNQIATDVAVEFDSGFVKLPYDFEIGYQGSEPRSAQSTNKYIIAAYDFTGDGIEELVFGVAAEQETSSFYNLQVNIFQYYPPALEAHALREENWELVTNYVFEGIRFRNITILAEDRSLTIPLGIRGFFRQITWANRFFLDTSNGR